MKVWFTADTHFGHSNIIKYTNRPFKDVEEMNEVMINNFNNKVEKNDLVFFIGDFCFGNPIPYLERLNGHKTFIQGNHDDSRSLPAIIDNAVLQIGDYNIYLTHIPEWASEAVHFNLVAHVHTHWKHNWLKPKKKKGLLVNVGVDVWDYKPVSFEEILKYLKEMNIMPKTDFSKSKKGKKSA